MKWTNQFSYYAASHMRHCPVAGTLRTVAFNGTLAKASVKVKRHSAVPREKPVKMPSCNDKTEVNIKKKNSVLQNHLHL